jgi:hypothetical protein
VSTANTPNTGILAAGIWPSAAVLRTGTPPACERFALVRDLGRLFRFVVADASEDDGYTAIVPALGGGAWLDVPEDDRGADLATATGSATIGVYGGPWRVIPAATLTGDVTYTLDPYYSDGTTLVRRGSSLLFTRLDSTAHAVSWVNGGAGAGTISTFANSQQAWLWAWFDGANWVKRASGVMV